MDLYLRLEVVTPKKVWTVKLFPTIELSMLPCFVMKQFPYYASL